MLAAQNALFIPVELSFKFKPFESILYKVINNIVDVLFVVDIILMFFTSFQNKKGKEINSSLKIAKNYIKTSRFVFDVLSVFGTGLFTLINSKMALFGFFKLARIGRL